MKREVTVMSLHLTESTNSQKSTRSTTRQLAQRYGRQAWQVTAFVLAVVLIHTTASAQVQADKRYQITASHSNKCVDVAGVSVKNGEAGHQWKCLQTDNQSWDFIASRSSPDRFMIRARHSGKCLDVEGLKSDNGTPVIQWECKGTTNQYWKLSKVGDSYQLISSLSPNKCPDVRGPSVDDGAKMQIWGCGGASQGNQLFKILPMDNPVASRSPWFAPDTTASYKIIEGTKGENLAVGEFNWVVRWGATGGKEQVWQISPHPWLRGRYHIRTRKFDPPRTDVMIVREGEKAGNGNAGIAPLNDSDLGHSFTFTKLTKEQAQTLAPKLYEAYKDQPVDFVWIHEWTRDGEELLTVGNTGTVYRSKKLNDNSQVFILQKEADTRQILFKNEAGYDAQIVVQYFELQDIGGAKVPMPKTVVSGFINVGQSRLITIPKGTAPNMPIQIFLQGNAMPKNNVFSATLEWDFKSSPVPCFRTRGSAFSPEGGKCN